MSRKIDLEQNIREAYQLISEYEAISRDTDEPKTRKRAHRIIKEQWVLIKGYADEYILLCQRIGAKMADDMVEIIAHFPEQDSSSKDAHGLDPSNQSAEYFVAHEFSEKKRGDLRMALQTGMAPLGLKPYFADQGVQTRHILDKIKDKIMNTRFSLFDLPASGNPNVYLELGLAIGLGKPFVLLVESGVKLPSLIAGCNYLSFDSYTELQQEIAEQVAAYVTQPNQFFPSKSLEASATFFVADGELSDAKQIRKTLSTAFADHALSPAYLNDSVGMGALLEQCINKIRCARFGVYRIDRQCSPDTFLVLGIALSLEQPYILIKHDDGVDPPSDLHGLIRFDFESLVQLQENLPVLAAGF